MGAAEQTYRNWLGAFGIAEPGARLVAIAPLSPVPAFAYAEGLRLRLKALVTPSGIVRPGFHPQDDWHGLLASGATASQIAAAVAWLETDETSDRPVPPVVVADAGRPQLETMPDRTLRFTGWFAQAGGGATERRVITVRHGTAVIECTPATRCLGPGGNEG